MLRIPSTEMVKMLGYLVDDDKLLKYGLDMKLGTDENELARENTILEAVSSLFARGGVWGHAKVVGVMFKDEERTCLAVASNDPNEPHFSVPSREVLDKFKKVLGMKREPRWYTYA